MTSGKSVRLFLADGTPGGLLTAEIVNWTGRVVAGPRSELGELLQRPETARTGIYILLGDDPESLGEPETIGRSISPVFELHLRKENLVARAQEVDGEFTVPAGSDARFGWPANSYNAVYTFLMEKLETDDTLEPIPDGSNNVFTHDQVFATPGAAGAVIVGHAANGRTKWRIPETGVNCGE
jgi:hypothetical protein